MEPALNFDEKTWPKNFAKQALNFGVNFDEKKLCKTHGDLLTEEFTAFCTFWVKMTIFDCTANIAKLNMQKRNADNLILNAVPQYRQRRIRC